MSDCFTNASCHGCHHGCHHGVDRRRFLQGCGAAAAGGLLTASGARAAVQPQTDRPRVAVVFLMSMDEVEIWPYPGFDTQARQREVMALLTEHCSKVEWIPVTVETAADAQKALAMKDDVDGYLIYVMTLVWAQRAMIVQLARLGKPTVVADEFLGGSGNFLTGYAQLLDEGVPAAGVSSTRPEDLIVAVGQFADVRQVGTTPELFARRCDEAYRKTFAAIGSAPCLDDPVQVADIGRCLERLRQSRFLIVGAGRGGAVEEDFLGVKGIYIDFDELAALSEQIDPDEAAAWAERWTAAAAELPPGDYVEPSRPEAGAVEKAGRIYLAMLELLKKYGTDSITMNCLGGFAAGKLSSYPCLGFMQLLNDGGQGVCEAMPDDTLSMLMARVLTGRPGFVSDPALDTSKNQVVYAHCVGTTKVFGTEGQANPYRIRTLHNRDPRGACAESLLPAGFMTTTFRTNIGRRQLVVHQARSLGALDAERGCRTKLIGEVHGDIEKLFHHWNRFSWHRVTVFGDVKEPLIELGKALGLEVIEEA